MINRNNKPNFIVSTGEIRINDAGAELYKRQEMLKAEIAELDRAWAGAFLVAIFLNHPWLERFTLEISTGYELDDDGGYYQTFSPVVRRANCLNDCSLPSAVSDDEGFCPDIAGDLLADEIDGHVRDLYLALVGPDAEEVSVELWRGAFASHLHGGAIDGRTAYLALFHYPLI